MRLYFAYGSNMDVGQMAARCPGARALGPARLDGWKFFINRRGTASVRPSISDSVWGVVWRVQPHHKGVLDHYEGIRLKRYLVREVSMRQERGRAARVRLCRNPYRGGTAHTRLPGGRRHSRGAVLGSAG